MRGKIIANKEQDTIDLLLVTFPLELFLSYVPSHLLASLRASVSVCPPIFSGKQSNFLCRNCFLWLPSPPLLPSPREARHWRDYPRPQPSPRPRGAPQCPFSSPAHCLRAKFVPHATNQPRRTRLSKFTRHSKIPSLVSPVASPPPPAGPRVPPSIWRVKAME